MSVSIGLANQSAEVRILPPDRLSWAVWCLAQVFLSTTSRLFDRILSGNLCNPLESFRGFCGLFLVRGVRFWQCSFFLLSFFPSHFRAHFASFPTLHLVAFFFLSFPSDAFSSLFPFSSIRRPPTYAPPLPSSSYSAASPMRRCDCTIRPAACPEHDAERECLKGHVFDKSNIWGVSEGI